MGALGPQHCDVILWVIGQTFGLNSQLFSEPGGKPEARDAERPGGGGQRSEKPYFQYW